MNDLNQTGQKACSKEEMICVDASVFGPANLNAENLAIVRNEFKHCLKDDQHLKERGYKIIAQRYGLTGEPAKTLQEIGLAEGVTRERIRQIELCVMGKYCDHTDRTERVKKTRDSLKRLFDALGGVALEKVLFAIADTDSAADKATIRLIAEALLEARETRETQRNKRYYYIGKDSPVAKAVTEAEKIMKEAGRPLTDAEFLPQLGKKLGFSAADTAAVRSILSVSKIITRSVFGEWGMKGWVDVTPHGVGDKAFIVLKREGKPLHFAKITEKINEIKFDDRVAQSQTVHNELIRDKRFVLVGRGLYGLTDWGYVSGTVADVLERVLIDAKAPLGKEDLLDRVLKERFVKKNTVVLALQNKDKFERNADGTYSAKAMGGENKKINSGASAAGNGSGVAA